MTGQRGNPPETLRALLVSDTTYMPERFSGSGDRHGTQPSGSRSTAAKRRLTLEGTRGSYLCRARSPIRSGPAALIAVFFPPLAPGKFPRQVACAQLIIWPLRD